ncbi:N-acetylmuramoyl-L-alanine amidase CwlD [Staphylospora marina]|uniref:N-acetylmuramoyl-L-alanine amidase CwlD n=1 Tax=Staphylospora marina TaxID=2490858 RepID=UPI000F5BC781|nr:N-acetylmuramoyl-L-alanine amidase CwlD [Staphylospora marina]
MKIRWFQQSGWKKMLLLLGAGFLIGLAALPSVWPKPSQTTWFMPLSGRVIVVDAGHGGPDGGAVSRTGLVEKTVTLNIAMYLRDYLQEAGALVIMTRESDTDLAPPDARGLRSRKAEDLMRRIRLIKEKQADALISIHLNSIPSPKWSGAQTFYNPVREENMKLASFIQAELIRNLQNTNRLPKQKGDIYLLKQSPVPTALVEVGFLSNPKESELLGQPDYQKKLAASIYAGILRYYAGNEPPPLQQP